MKNLQHIEKKILKLMLPLYAGLALALLLTKQFTSLNSVTLGLFFSYLSLKNLMASGAQIASKKSSSIYFKHQFFRLGLFAIPIATSLYLKNYFNLPIILLSLFAFQGCFIIFELVKGIKKIRKNKL